MEFLDRQGSIDVKRMEGTWQRVTWSQGMLCFVLSEGEQGEEEQDGEQQNPTHDHLMDGMARANLFTFTMTCSEAVVNGGEPAFEADTVLAAGKILEVVVLR